MKKRKFVSIALTILVIVVTLNYWFLSRPLTFSMDIKSQSEKPIIVTTVLNRKDDLSFLESYEKESQINLQKTNKYNISFCLKTPPKRLRLILNQIEPNIEYQISNLSFRNGKYPVSDLSKFKSENAKLKINGNSLVIISNSDTATLDYSERITARQAKKFDLKIFFIITILSFLLFFKLTSYLADFKINKNASRLDIIFLAICAALLFIPMFNINQDVKSEQENRNLAEWKPLFNKDNSINLNFGKDYDSWISDRFGMRRFLIGWYRNFKIAITTRYYMMPNAYWDKQTNWMFDRIQLVQKPLAEEQIKEISTALIDFNAFCKNNNIKLYVLISPRKENVYVQNSFLKENRGDIYKESINKIRENTKIPIVYPFDELIDASKKDFTFFKTDHHWTDWGAYIGYKALMKEIKKDYSGIKEANINDFKILHSNLVRSEFSRKHAVGVAYKLLNLPYEYRDKILDIEYTYFIHKNNKLLKKEIEDNTKLAQKSFEYEKGANLKAFLIGSSPSENLTEIFPYTFKNTRYIRINKPKDILDNDIYKLVKLYKQNIINYNPDIIVFCIQSHNLSNLKDLVNED